MKLPGTLSFRLMLWYTTAFVLFLVLSLITAYFSMNSVLNYRIDEDLHEDILEFRELYTSEGLRRVQTEIQREIKSGNADNIFFRLLTLDGKVIFSSDLSSWKNLTSNEQPFISASTLPALETISLESKESSTRIIYDVIGPDIILHIGESVEEKEELMAIFFTLFITLFVVALPAASFIGWLMSHKAVRGIKEISQIAANIQGGHLDQRVIVSQHGDEIKQLADTFNAMLDRIKDLVIELQEMTDNIAHDLRSPLARIRALSEGVLCSDKSLGDESRAAISSTIEESDHLLQMINATLDIADARAGLADGSNTPVNISQLAVDACELFEALAEQKHVKLRCIIDIDCIVQGNNHYLQRMYANLLDNAIKYTPENGEVNVSLTCNDNSTIIVVEDTGIGIPKSDLDKIFDRFFRSDQSRSLQGCGMGLSFVQAVVEGHGGNIHVDSTLGRGSSFTINLPSIRVS